MPTQSYPANPSWPPYLASLQAWGGIGGGTRGGRSSRVTEPQSEHLRTSGPGGWSLARCSAPSEWGRRGPCEGSGRLPETPAASPCVSCPPQHLLYLPNNLSTPHPRPTPGCCSLPSRKSRALRPYPCGPAALRPPLQDPPVLSASHAGASHRVPWPGGGLVLFLVCFPAAPQLPLSLTGFSGPNHKVGTLRDTLGLGALRWVQ